MSKSNLPPQDPKKQYDFPSLDLIFELTKERLAGQMQQVSNLDTKANFVLGSATALISAAVVLQAVLITPQTTALPAQSQPITLPFYCPLPSDKFLRALPLLMLLLVYLLVVLIAYLSYKIRVYKQVPEPGELYKTYLYKHESDTKAEVFRAMLDAYKANDHTIRDKVTRLKAAFILLGCEAISLVVYLFFQTTC
jgi:hypothetical protein